MGRKSSIARLPPEVRELIGKLRGDGRTIEEILAKLHELDVQVSQSALGRWTKQLDAIASEVNRNRHIAEALVERFGDKPDNRAARMNIELMHALITRLMFAEDGSMVTIDPQEAYFLGTALQRLAAAQKTDTERTLKLEQATARKAAERAVTAADEAARKNGHTLPPEALKTIREQVYGIVER